jgi:hypothetical protein
VTTLILSKRKHVGIDFASEAQQDAGFATGARAVILRSDAAVGTYDAEMWSSAADARMRGEYGTMKKGGVVKKMKKGGIVSSASKRADGIASKVKLAEGW